MENSKVLELKAAEHTVELTRRIPTEISQSSGNDDQLSRCQHAFEQSFQPIELIGCNASCYGLRGVKVGEAKYRGLPNRGMQGLVMMAAGTRLG